MLCDSLSRDGSVKTDRQQILDLEHQLAEARGRLEELKEWVGVHKDHHKDGQSEGCACAAEQRRLQIRSTMFEGIGPHIEVDLSKDFPKLHSAAESVWLPDEEERMSLDPTGANTDGLLLAVDKFLSSEDRPRPTVSSLLPGQASSD